MIWLKDSSVMSPESVIIAIIWSPETSLFSAPASAAVVSAASAAAVVSAALVVSAVPLEEPHPASMEAAIEAANNTLNVLFFMNFSS